MLAQAAYVSETEAWVVLYVSVQVKRGGSGIQMILHIMPVGPAIAV